MDVPTESEKIEERNESEEKVLRQNPYWVKIIVNYINI